MEDVIEVNESDAHSEYEMSREEKRRLRKSRERQKVTLGGEIKFTEEDYERMNLICKGRVMCRQEDPNR
jgi:hypothetical protein